MADPATSKKQPSERDRMHERMVADVREAYARHQITMRGPALIPEAGEGRWVLRRVNEKGEREAFYWTEVACLAGGYLYVGGDISTMVFGIADTHGADRVRWLGGTTDLGYVAQKASIGMGTDALTKEYRPEVAVADLRSLSEEYERHEWDAGRACTPDDEVQAALYDLENYVHDGAVALHARMLEAFDETPYLRQASWLVEDRGVLGMVLSARVYYAWGALERLTQLLDAEKGT